MQMCYTTSFDYCCSLLKTPPFLSIYSYYSGSILRVSGFPSSLAIWLSCIPFSVNFLCTFIGIYAVEKAGRRVLTLLSFIGRFLEMTLYCSFLRLVFTLLRFEYYILHECYTDCCITFLDTINNFHFRKKLVFFSTEKHSDHCLSNHWFKLFHTGISDMFVFCRNHHRTDCTWRWVSALWEKFSTHLPSIGQFLQLPY